VSLAEELLLAARQDDGGFGPVAGTDPEPEPTAMAAMALDDSHAREWLARRVASDGHVGLTSGSVSSDEASVVACALDAGPELERLLARVEAGRAAPADPSDVVPHDPAHLGWPWTPGTFGWVEPTAWAVLALRRYRPGSAVLGDGIAVLRDRECRGGGWNYGNPVAFGEVLPPFGQTTALGLLAVRGVEPDLAARAAAALRRLWREESTGLLTLATAAAALRITNDEDSEAAMHAVHRAMEDAEALPPPDTISLAWVALALGPIERLERLRP
jgi:hypothetical protein